ncbi:MAG: hypothetical protein JW724_03270 [Candidatus Altiarchaeota archaeon]|nr:hypothetical protein [Candidatus Altiarchaeota archaeon]
MIENGDVFRQQQGINSMTEPAGDMLEMRGIKELWASVISLAVETATQRVPEKDTPGYGRKRMDKDRARRFFGDSPTSTLEFACQVLDRCVKTTRKGALRIINEATEPLNTKALMKTIRKEEEAQWLKTTQEWG